MAIRRRARVEGVLDQLLDDRGGTLDDLAGGDLVREMRGQAVDAADADPTPTRLDCHIQPFLRKNQSMMPEITSISDRNPPELRRLAARQVRQRDVHAPHAGQHRQRHEDRGDDGQDLHHAVQLVRHVRKVRVEQAGDAVLEEHRLVGEPDQVIVDVAKAVRQRFRDQRELASGQPADGVTLRQHDAPQRARRRA